MKQLLILGTGCGKCAKLYELAEQAAEELGIEYEIRKVTDLQQIMALRVVATPAFVVDGSVRVAGRLPSLEDIKTMLT